VRFGLLGPRPKRTEIEVGVTSEAWMDPVLLSTGAITHLRRQREESKFHFKPLLDQQRTKPAPPKGRAPQSGFPFPLADRPACRSLEFPLFPRLRLGLAQLGCQPHLDLPHEFEGIQPVFALHGLPVDAQCKVLGHTTVFHGTDAGVLQGLSKRHQGGILVQHSALLQGTRPRKDACDRVRTRLATLLVLPIVTSDSAMRGLGLKGAILVHEHRCHQTQAAKGLSNAI